MEINNFLVKKSYAPLFEYILKKDINEILLSSPIVLTPKQLNKFSELLEKMRLDSHPIQYLTKSTYFYKDKFYVDKRVLIPRPETEYIVDEAIKYINNFKGSTNIVDVGTGSGCIGISIAKYVSKDHRISLIDSSTDAVKVCRINVQNILNNTSNINILEGNLLDEFDKNKSSKINVLVSNLPYISSEDIKNLPKSVKDFEPRTALIGGIKGYEVISELLTQSVNYIANEFLILLEIDPSESEILFKIAKNLYKNSNINIIKDLFNIKRYLRIESK